MLVLRSLSWPLSWSYLWSTGPRVVLSVPPSLLTRSLGILINLSKCLKGGAADLGETSSSLSL
jgi:hypothetical protein